jgi:hypothetical protein
VVERVVQALTGRRRAGVRPQRGDDLVGVQLMLGRQRQELDQVASPPARPVRAGDRALGERDLERSEQLDRQRPDPCLHGALLHVATISRGLGA